MTEGVLDNSKGISLNSWDLKALDLKTRLPEILSSSSAAWRLGADLCPDQTVIFVAL